MMLRVILCFFLFLYSSLCAIAVFASGTNDAKKPSVKELLSQYEGKDILDAVKQYNNSVDAKDEIVCQKNKVFGLFRSGLVCSKKSELEENNGKMTDEDMDKIITAYNKMMKDRKQLVCRREKVTGTRLSKRVCRSKWDIEQNELNAQTMLKDLDRRKQVKND